jgi:ATP-binding protein involved in chromosome partitioning
MERQSEREAGDRTDRAPGDGDAPPIGGGTDELVAAVREALGDVVDPELGADIVSLGMLQDVEVTADGDARVRIGLTIAGCPLRRQLRQDVEARLRRLEGIRTVTVETGVLDAEGRRTVMERARRVAAARSTVDTLGPRTRVLAIASGKGGVGKSSVAANLALALAARGGTVGLLDADIAGFSIPALLGLEERLEGEGDPAHWRLRPANRMVGAGQLRVVSMGLIASSTTEAIMWRGLLLHRALQHFVEDVAWGEDLDYLVVDLPPGTADVQMGLARLLPRTEMLVVTTPTRAVAEVAERVGDMARRSHLRIVGVVESMSGFTCAHGVTYALFGAGGGDILAERLGVPVLARLPFDPQAADAADRGRPLALDADSPFGDAIRRLAADLADEIAPTVALETCSARLLSAIEAAVGPAPATADRTTVSPEVGAGRPPR